ncbi:hypothetical protein [Anaerovibrio sp.]|uniref:hypothetical protein n=1 Tax=Anaerovibrio sp. TaxID=1872532 RepID=UPI0025BDAF7F|nr:hypothetical protein [Anaerovibrio sp.]MBR2141711.1 hypothetical protein [Anaerovibrio sp.]
MEPASRTHTLLSVFWPVPTMGPVEAELPLFIWGGSTAKTTSPSVGPRRQHISHQSWAISYRWKKVPTISWRVAEGEAMASQSSPPAPFGD